MVEFALVVPVFLLLLTGIVQLGTWYNHQLILTNAAREGARHGAWSKTEAEVQTAVLDYMKDAGYQPLPAASDIKVKTANGKVTVSLSSKLTPIVPTFGPNIQLKAQSTMAVE